MQYGEKAPWEIKMRTDRWTNYDPSVINTNVQSQSSFLGGGGRAFDIKKPLFFYTTVQMLLYMNIYLKFRMLHLYLV